MWVGISIQATSVCFVSASSDITLTGMQDTAYAFPLARLVMYSTESSGNHLQAWLATQLCLHTVQVPTMTDT